MTKMDNPAMVAIEYHFEDGQVRRYTGAKMNHIFGVMMQSLIHEAIDQGIDVRQVFRTSEVEVDEDEIEEKIKAMANESTAGFMEGMDK